MKSPLITMTAVTGKPTPQIVENYMKSLKQNGIEQVMICLRSGYELEYFSDELFDTVEGFLKCADFNRPSGNACGAVSAKYPLRSITVTGENVGSIST